MSPSHHTTSNAIRPTNTFPSNFHMTIPLKTCVKLRLPMVPEIRGGPRAAQCAFAVYTATAILDFEVLHATEPFCSGHVDATSEI